MKVVIVVGLNLLRKERENSPAKDPAVSFACFELWINSVPVPEVWFTQFQIFNNMHFDYMYYAHVD